MHMLFKLAIENSRAKSLQTTMKGLQMQQLLVHECFACSFQLYRQNSDTSLRNLLPLDLQPKPASNFKAKLRFAPVSVKLHVNAVVLTRLEYI